MPYLTRDIYYLVLSTVQKDFIWMIVTCNMMKSGCKPVVANSYLILTGP